jgi:1,4-alpha-glucan branching enzyme
MLALSSDWAFMITKDSAAQYARSRHDLHHRRFQTLADVIENAGMGSDAALGMASDLRGPDGLFGHLDARALW